MSKLWRGRMRCGLCGYAESVQVYIDKDHSEPLAALVCHECKSESLRPDHDRDDAAMEDGE